MEYHNLDSRNPREPLEIYYECPCSKVYRSYPALYVHIKSKHQGKVTPFLPRLQESSKNLPFQPRKEEDLLLTVPEPLSRVTNALAQEITHRVNFWNMTRGY